MKTKKSLKIFGGIVIILLIIAAFADLQISHSLYNPASGFGKIFEAIGEFPAMFIAAFCTISIAVIQRKRNNGRLNLKSIAGFVFGALFALASGVLPVTYLNGPKVLGMVFGILILAADIFMAASIARNREEELYKAAVFGLELFLIVLILFNLIKLGWGRERYRHMVQIGDFAGFTAWYLPQGLASGNEFMSFPSGHSANAAIAMWVTLLPTFLPSLETKEKLLTVIAFIWTICVMLSRIIMGAHFLGDVTMGAAISLLTFYILYRKKYQR